MTKDNATKPISLRFSPSVRKTVKKISDDSGLMQSAIFDMILRAGCSAIEKNDFSFVWPLHFHLEGAKKVHPSKH
jgi:hypothetical protein